MKRLKVILVVVVPLVFAGSGYADGDPRAVQECWAHQQDRGGDNDINDAAHDLAMAVDEDGYIYVTHPRWVNSDYEIVVKKLAPDETLLWETTWDEGYDHFDDDHPGDIPRAIAVDAGIVCVTGQMLDLGEPDEWNDYVTFCLDAEDGDFLWTGYTDNARTYDQANEDDEAFAIAMCDGYVYVTGESKDGPDDSDNDVVTIKYNASTGYREWTDKWDENPIDRADYASSIAVDEDCNVYVAGGTQVGILGWQFDWLVVSYDPAGNLRWDDKEDGGGAFEGCVDYAWDIIVPDSCSPCAVYVTGQLCEGVGEGLNYATAKYPCAGTEPLSTGDYDLLAGKDAAHALDADSTCNIYVTGEAWDGNEYDLVTLKYGQGLGDELAVNRYTPGGRGRDIVVDDCDFVYATGWTENNNQDPPSDYLTIKYEQHDPGDPSDFGREWTETQDHRDKDHAYVIVSYACETVYVAGEIEETSPYDLDIVIKKYSERGSCCNSDTYACEDDVAEVHCQGPDEVWQPCRWCEEVQGCCYGAQGTCENLRPWDCVDLHDDGNPQCPGTDCDISTTFVCCSGGSSVPSYMLCCDDIGGTLVLGEMPSPEEACCLSDGTCVMADPACCEHELVEGLPQGPGTACTQPAACCLEDGTCADADPLCCDDLAGWEGYQPYCLGDVNGNGIDDACESPQACCLPSGYCVDVRYEGCLDRGGDPQGLGTECATLPMDCSPLKWAQPPEPAYPENVYYGWNEFSGCCHAAVADDWVCDTDEPVFAIHWWGSYQDWTGTDPPDEPFDHFHIFIWTDVPAGVDEPFSHPGVVVHEIIANLDQVAWNFVGWDYDPRTGKYEAAFRYDYFLSEPEYFHQQAGENIYWISIGGGYCGMEPGPNAWGWKTRRRDPSSPAPDAAVLMPNPGHIYTPPGTTWEDIGGGAPIYWPDPEDSWDMAFELSSRWAQATPKWEQLPDPEWPGLPAHDSEVQGTKLADQWLCQGEDVDALYWYGNYELDAAGGEIRGSGINHFHLSIHNNVPGDPWCLPQDPEIWGADVPFYAILEEDTGMVNSEGSPIYRYRYVLPWPFEQTEDEIYWFDITAISNSPDDPAHWRWQEAGRDPVPILCPAARQYYPGPSPWESIIWPDGDPILYTDLAFEVASIFYGEADVKWSQPPEPYVPPDAYNGWNELSVYGDEGDTQIVADDWYCDTELPVTDLHWWGSFIGWSEQYPPPDLPADLAFHIAIWTDVPVGEDEDFSHPGIVLWEALCEEVSIDFAGWDFDPRDPAAPPEACFKFRCYFAEEDWFYQDAGDNIYWVSISAVYPAGAVPEYPWGWKARPRDADSPAPDDAVRIFDPTAPTADPPSVFISGEPIEWPAGDSWDMAFVLTTTLPPEAKWSQLPHGPEEGFDAASDLWWSGPAPGKQREPLAATAEEALPRVLSGPQMTNMGEELVPVFTGHVLSGADGRGTGILYAPAQPDNSGFREAVSGITGEPCDYFDVRFATPTVAQMLNYACVFTWINYACADPVQFGDNLAAYVDAGGSVILGHWCYDTGQGNFLEGQIMTPAYCPITAVSWPCDGGIYAGDGVTCIHEGVTAYSADAYHEHCTLVAGALSDGTFICGWLSVGYRPDFRVFYSAGNTGFDWGTGDWDLLVANMCACGEQEPNKVVADDFVSDGRPIEALIWWGSYLDEQYAPEQDPVEPYILDGWLISFHHTEPDAVCPPDALSGDDPTVLGVYFAPAGAVEIAGLFMADCFGHGVYIYNVDLDRCCLLCSEPDPRPAAVPPDPARPGGFLETAGLRYWLDIQAVVGVQWLPESDPECEMVFTGHLPSPDMPDGHFWGWHTSPGPADPYEPMEEACTGRIVDFTPYPPDCPDYGDWVKQPWLCPTGPLPVHMAFELLTSAPRIVSVSSYHLHGTFECPLDLTDNNIEPRGCGIQTLNVTFAENLSGASVDASVQCWDEDYTGSMTVDPPVGSLVTLHFDPQLPDETCCCITFSGDASGSVEVRSLIGDQNRNNATEAGDVDVVRNYLGQDPTTEILCNADLNCNGVIEVGDSEAIKNYVGNQAAECP